MKKIKKIIIILLLVIVIGVIATITFLKFFSKDSTPNEVKVISTIKDYGYTLDDNESSLYKGYFYDLVDTLKEKEVDEESYAILVTQLFISDFYNLSNKITKNDIGGTQYIYTAALDNMALKAKDTMYKYVENNLDGKRTQVLPKVSTISIDSTTQEAFTYGDETDDEAFKIVATWTYKEDLDYQTTAIFMLIHEGNKLVIAEIK